MKVVGIFEKATTNLRNLAYLEYLINIVIKKLNKSYKWHEEASGYILNICLEKTTVNWQKLQSKHN